MGGITKGLDLHVWFRWMGKKMSGGCIIEVLGMGGGVGLGWQFQKGVMLEGLEDGQVSICEICMCSLKFEYVVSHLGVDFYHCL